MNDTVTVINAGPIEVIINSQKYVVPSDTLFFVQIGRYKSAYKNRYVVPATRANAAVMYYNGLNIGNGYKKRLKLGDKVLAKVAS